VPRTPQRSLRVLVAEDTPASQVVARTMLEKLGHRVQVVGDGDEAVAAAATGRFDVILMDVQMPNIDGYEATGQIRASGGPAAQTPIVALTAFAQPADRDRVLKAGMTDYLRKPIRIGDLAALLERLGAADAFGAASPSHGAVDAQALAELRESVGGDAFVRLLERFYQDAGEALAEIDAATEAADFSRARQAAHRVNGLFHQFGAIDAAEAAASVELAGDGEIAARIDDLRSHGRAALDAIRAEYAVPA
jgi:CheY-like chemotaxis protein